MEIAERSPDTKYKVCKGPLCNGIEKTLSEFSNKLSICKKCSCYKIKEHYKKNGRAYRNCKNEIKSNSKCIECGCDDIRLLEFDHTGHKNVTIAKSFSKDKIQEEVKLTQVLCIWCHRLKTRADLDKQMDEKSFIITERPTSETDGKKCIGDLCQGQLQFKNMFYASQHKSFCKVCLAFKFRKQREDNYNFLTDMKIEQKECALCKKEVTRETVSCFDYDHLRDKEVTLAILVRKCYNTQQQMTEEAKKCRLLCCCCHRIVTAKQLNFNFEIMN
jgi:hypothetical protein